MKRILAIVGLVASSLGSGAALAIPVEYNGAVFDFNVTGTGGGTNQYYITYTADFTNWVDNGQTNIGGIQFSIGGNSVLSASLTSAPGGIAGWTVSGNQNLSASGCGGGAIGGSCAQDSAPFLSTGGDPTYSWVFLVTYTSSLGDLSVFNATNSGNAIRMWFVDANGRNRGLMSCQTANANGECDYNVPEPGTLALLGLGLLGMGLTRRRRV